MMLLTQEERDKFGAWLDQEIRSNAPLIEQMVAMKISEAVVNKMKTETMACAVVLKILRSIESQEL